MKRNFFITLLVLLITSCNKQLPDNVKSVMFFNSNSDELEAVINHYKESKDTLKLQAAYFLIGNMDDKYGESFRYINDQEQSGFYLYINANSKDYTGIKMQIDSLEDKDHSYSWVSEKEFDKKIIKAADLIENIDYSFKVWREMPWASKLDFKEFCEYILPYRINHEPYSNWRKSLYEKYKWVLDSVKDKSDPVEACTILNRELASWLDFHAPFSLTSGIRSVLETETYKKGTCNDHALFAASAMRAIGIPVAIDYTPAWADRSWNHTWNVVFPTNGNPIPFNAANSVETPGRYKINAKIAKVFRFTYENQPTSLPNFKSDNLPDQLDIKNIKDVTGLYCSTSDITLTLQGKKLDNKIAYLSIYNSGDWKVINWGKVIDSYVTFQNVGRNILYLPVKNNSFGQNIPIHAPILLDKDGEIRVLDCKADLIVNITAIAHNKFLEYDSAAVQSIKPNKDYELIYWDKKWISHSIVKTSDYKALFINVPSNTIYKIVEVGANGRHSRVFTYECEKQRFW